MIRLARAGIDDQGILVEMYQRLMEDEGHKGEVPPISRLKTKMKEWLQSKEFEAALFLDVDDVPVGYALWEWFTDAFNPRERNVFLRQFYVERDHRRRGIGSRAFHALKKQYWTNANHIELEMYIWNKVGAAFWRHMGFESLQIGFKLEMPRS